MGHKAVYLLFSKFTLHVSGVNRTYHQEFCVHGWKLAASNGSIRVGSVLSISPFHQKTEWNPASETPWAFNLWKWPMLDITYDCDHAPYRNPL